MNYTQSFFFWSGFSLVLVVGFYYCNVHELRVKNDISDWSSDDLFNSYSIDASSICIKRAE